MEFLDFQLDILQIPADLKATLGANFSCLGDLCANSKYPLVWKNSSLLNRALSEFGLKLQMDTGSWVAPKDRKVRPVLQTDIDKILQVGICKNEKQIKFALSINKTVNEAVRWLIENESIEKVRLEILKKKEANSNVADVQRAWNPGHGIISEGKSNAKFVHRKEAQNSSQPKRTSWRPEQRYRSVLSDEPEDPKGEKQVGEVQREGRSHAESESGEDELLSAPSVPVREGLDGSDDSSEKEEEQFAGVVNDVLVEDKGSEELSGKYGVIGEKRKIPPREAKDNVVEQESQQDEILLRFNFPVPDAKTEPLVPSKPPQPMKSLIDHNAQPHHSYFSRSPGHGRPWGLNAHHQMVEGSKPVCSFNLRPKAHRAHAPHVNHRMQRIQQMEYIRMQQHRRRAMERFQASYNPYYSETLRQDFLRESEAMYKEMRRQETMRTSDPVATSERQRIDPAWERRYEQHMREAAFGRHANMHRGRDYYVLRKKQDPANAYWRGYPHNSSSKSPGKDADEVRAFGRQTVLEGMDHSRPPPAALDPRSNRAEDYIYFPDQAIPAKAQFSKAPGEPVRKRSTHYIITPSPSPPAAKQTPPIHSHRNVYKQHQDKQDSKGKSLNSENVFENTTRSTSKPWHPFVSAQPEKTKLSNSQSPGASTSPSITDSEPKPSKSASSDKLNMHTFIKSLSAAKLPKKEEPLNNDQLSFWQKLVKTTKKNERENVENFFKMFQNSSSNRNDNHDSIDFDDEFNHERDLMKLITPNAETSSSSKSAKSDDEDPTAAFFESLLQRSKEQETHNSTSTDEDDQSEEEDVSDFKAEIIYDDEQEQDSDTDESGDQKSESPDVIRENLETDDGGPPNYLTQPPPDATAPEQDQSIETLKVNDEEFLISLQQLATSRGWQKRKQLQTNPEVETDRNLYRRQIENLLRRHDDTKLKQLDYLLACFEDSQRLYETLRELYKVDSLNNSGAPELCNQEPERSPGPPPKMLKQDPTKSEKLSLLPSIACI